MLLGLATGAVMVLDGGLHGEVNSEASSASPFRLLLIPAGYITGLVLQRVWAGYSPFRIPGDDLD
jgi:hypothetical protein